MFQCSAEQTQHRQHKQIITRFSPQVFYCASAFSLHCFFFFLLNMFRINTYLIRPHCLVTDLAVD